MANTWVTDMRHYLDGRGAMGKLPGPALSLALFLGSIVAWVTSGRSLDDRRTNVPCCRSPGRRRGLGEILATVDPNPTVMAWRCPLCGDNGVIRGWESTAWDRGAMPRSS
ncbi:MAG: hypothetical protein ACRELA_18595 [Candidatus Rokuibacteriota bacterium]